MNRTIGTTIFFASLAALSLSADSSFYTYRPLSQEQLQPGDFDESQHRVIQPVPVELQEPREDEDNKVIRYMNTACGCFMAAVVTIEVSAAALLTYHFYSYQNAC